MKRALIIPCLLALACGPSTTTKQDGSTRDLFSGGSDGPVDLKMVSYTSTTAHDIDVGSVVDKTPVRLTGMVLTGVATNAGSTKTSMRCKYAAVVQDASGTAPTGIKLSAIAASQCALQNGKCDCPYPPNSGTVLDTATVAGDIFDITGWVYIYAPTDADAGVLPAQHSVDLDAMTKTGSGGSVAAETVTDGSLLAPRGQGYVTYENTLVKLQPAQAFTITAPNQYGEFTDQASGAQFGGNYRFIYSSTMTPYPTGGSVFVSITGIADPSYDGSVNARSRADFVSP